jgi:ribosomal 50S subunit-recycling heat shock protein
VRLDKFLKLSRLIKRRTVANTIADAGYILVNGKPAKPSHSLKVGDTITLETTGQQPGHQPLKVKVLIVPTTKQIAPDLASTLYEMVENTAINTNS